MSPEKVSSPKESKITVPQRRKLLPRLAEDINTARNDLAIDVNWPIVEPFTTYIGLSGFLERPDMLPQETSHIKKMMAFERKLTPKESLKSTKARRFINLIDNEIEEEIEAIASFNGDRDTLSHPYQIAVDDWTRLRDELKNPLLLSLRQTAQSLRKRKS